MKIKGVNKDRCPLCGECVLDCPPQLYSIAEAPSGEKTIAYEDPHERCMYCGHCVAVCPHDAIDYDGEPFSTFPGIDKPETLVEYETLLRVFRARRSVRRFRFEKLGEETIKKVLEAIRHAPSGSNKQSWELIVVTDPKTRDELVSRVLRVFKITKRFLFLKWFLAPFIGRINRKFVFSSWLPRAIDKVIADFKRGHDRILFRAPAVIIIHSPEYGHVADNDAGIAFTLAMFAAQSLGLGTCWSGFVTEAFRWSKALRRFFGIPPGHKVRGVLAIGYPDVHYGRVPERKPITVRWM